MDALYHFGEVLVTARLIGPKMAAGPWPLGPAAWGPGPWTWCLGPWPWAKGQPPSLGWAWAAWPTDPWENPYIYPYTVQVDEKKPPVLDKGTLGFFIFFRVRVFFLTIFSIELTRRTYFSILF